MAMKHYYKTDIMERGLTSPLPTPFAPVDNDVVVCVENAWAPQLTVKRLVTFADKEGVRLARDLFAKEGFFLPNEPRAAWYALNYFDDKETNEMIRSVSNGNVAEILNLDKESLPSRETMTDVAGNPFVKGDMVIYLEGRVLELGRIDSINAKAEEVKIWGVTEDNFMSQNIAMNDICVIQMTDERRALIRDMPIKEIRDFYSAPSKAFWL
jgi:hypothetical protein